MGHCFLFLVLATVLELGVFSHMVFSDIIIIIIIRWLSSAMRAVASLMDFSQLALFFDLSFQFLILHLSISLCPQFYHLFIRRGYRGYFLEN